MISLGVVEAAGYTAYIQKLFENYLENLYHYYVKVNHLSSIQHLFFGKIFFITFT